MQIIEENKYFKVIADPYFENIKKDLISYLDVKIKYIMTFFRLDNIDKINIYLYTDKEEFQRVTRHPYSTNYLAGAYNIFGIRVYVDLNAVSKREFYSCITHELVHLIYQNYIQEKGIQNKVVWFEEGLAENLSGEKDFLLDDDNLREYLAKNIYRNDKTIPEINQLYKHGNSFINSRYNGYVWSYLIIRYLLEQTPIEEFNKIMRSKNKIDNISRELPEITYNYFRKKMIRRF